MLRKVAAAARGRFVGCAGRALSPSGVGHARIPVRNRRRAFTLIEVLVVVAIIALLVSILMPSLQRARKQARQTLCLNNLHQMSVALFAYQADYKGQVPRWRTDYEQVADGLALWAQRLNGDGYATRLGILYPRYVGKNENIYYCPDATTNGLLNKGTEGKTSQSLYPWSNYGKRTGWAYGSYEYRPRYYVPSSGQFVWVGAGYEKARATRFSIAADGFAGSWDAFGPYPAHSPIQERPRMLYYNVAYMDGSARPAKDFLKQVSGGNEFGTRAAVPRQQKPLYVNAGREGGIGNTSVPGEYTPLEPGPLSPPLPDSPLERQQEIQKTNNIDRGWSFFDQR